MKNRLLNETTEIPPARTAQQIQNLLVECGASLIATEFNASKPTGISFALMVNGAVHQFKMPVRTAGVARIFRERRIKSAGAYSSIRYKAQDDERAERVAWRQLFRWTQAQLAMIQSGAAEAREVFLPYLWDGQKTLFEAVEATRFKALSAEQGRPNA